MKNIFEYILQEASKYRFLEPLYNTYSSKINNCPSFNEILKYVDTNNISFDWQNKDKEKLFNTIVDSYIQYKQKGGSIKDRKQDAKNLFIDKFTTDKPGKAWGYNFFLHNDLETEEYLFLSVLSYDAAKYCDSFECGGEGAKWCIGYEKDDGYWKDYVNNNKYLFVLAFNKKEYANKSKEKNKLKYMLTFDPECIEESKAWVQDDNEVLCIPCTEWKHKFGRSFNEILKSIDNADVISAVHFEEDRGEFFTNSPWIKSSLFDRDHVYERMYMTVEDETSRVTYIDTLKETGFINNCGEIIIDGDNKKLTSSMIYNYDDKENKGVLDLPTLLDYIAKNTKPFLNNEAYNKKVYSLIIQNADIENLIWDPEATSNNVRYTELKNCDVDNLDWIDYSDGNYDLEFDNESNLENITWECSPDTFYAMSSSNLKLHGMEPNEEYAEEDNYYEEDYDDENNEE